MGARNPPENPVATEEQKKSHTVNKKPQLAFACGIFLFFVLGLVDALQHSYLGGVFTGGVSAVMLLFSGIVIWQLATGNVDDPVNYDHEISGEHVGVKDVASLGHYIYWFIAFLLGVATVGFLIALVFFFVAFLRTKARASWLRTIILTTAAVASVTILARLMVLDFPPGLLQYFVDLPWPLR
jgi:hypothetical protein